MAPSFASFKHYLNILLNNTPHIYIYPVLGAPYNSCICLSIAAHGVNFSDKKLALKLIQNHCVAVILQ